MIGQTISHYKVTAKIGEGGMGEVYRATDSKLGRDVALKVLPAAVANDPDRLARFEREAQLLASLNHPNIATIHGIEDGAGVRALVMELVEGQPLSSRLTAGTLRRRFRRHDGHDPTSPDCSPATKPKNWRSALRLGREPRSMQPIKIANWPALTPIGLCGLPRNASARTNVSLSQPFSFS